MRSERDSVPRFEGRFRISDTIPYKKTAGLNYICLFATTEHKAYTYWMYVTSSNNEHF
jgi:hypothetical protein